MEGLERALGLRPGLSILVFSRESDGAHPTALFQPFFRLSSAVRFWGAVFRSGLDQSFQARTTITGYFEAPRDPNYIHQSRFIHQKSLEDCSL